MKKTDLLEKASISSVTLAKLSKNENVSTEILIRIADALNCDISEIVKSIKEEVGTKMSLYFDNIETSNQDDMDILSLEDISKETGKTLKLLRREITSGSLKRINGEHSIRVYRKEYNEWVKSITGSDCYEDKTAFQENDRINKTKKSNDIVNWIDVSKEFETIDGWANHDQIQDINFIDLFTGAGGLSCGLVMAGMTPVGSVEIMPEAVETYKYNFGKLPQFNENVEDRDIREQEVKQHLANSVKGKHIDLIAGGFPCQGFSMAGNRIVTDPRNSLYLDMLEIVKTIKPDFVLMENVEGLRSMLDGKIEEKIISDYKEIGYEINVTILNSADYGVPQQRHRVIFIGNRIGAVNYHPKPIYDESNYNTVGWALEKYLNLEEDKSINHIMSKHSPQMLENLAKIPVGKSLYGNYSDGWKKVDWNKPSCTVKENHGGVNVHPILNRCMTPRELAALQSFPDNFIFKGSKKWQLVQIGNAVPPILGKAIGLAIIKAMEEAKKNDGQLC
ncbi:DNA (cytosine-5-)-methyltransferase [Ureaplasma parvum]